MFYREEMKFPPKQKQTLFCIVLNIQLGRKPKQHVRPPKDIDPPEWGWMWCKCQSLPGCHGEHIYPLVLFWGWKKAEVYGSQVTNDVQAKAVDQSTKQWRKQAFSGWLTEKWEDAFNWLTWAFAFGMSNRVETSSQNPAAADGSRLVEQQYYRKCLLYPTHSMEPYWNTNGSQYTKPCSLCCVIQLLTVLWEQS